MTIGEAFPHSEIDTPSYRRKRRRPDWRPAKPEDALRRRIEARQPRIKAAFGEFDRLFPAQNRRYDPDIEALLDEREFAHVAILMGGTRGWRRLDQLDEAVLKAITDRLARHRR
jgi:hypothetical protein